MTKMEKRYEKKQLNENSSNSLQQMEALSLKFKQINQNTSSIGKATDHIVEAINEELLSMQELNERTTEEAVESIRADAGMGSKIAAGY